jgi:DNA-binding winged helix-turn-helix (wHTH) protein
VIYRFENCVLDIDRRELCRGGIVCPIEPQVFDLLHFLIANRDRVVSRDEIFQTVWRGRFVSESVLGNRINAVRKALGDDGIRQGLIRTVHRKGFRFVGAAFEQAECKELPDRGNAIILRPGKVSLAVLPMTIWPGDLEIAYISKGLAEDLTVALARSRSFDVIAHDRICIGDDNVMRIAREFAAAYLVVCSLRKADDSTRLSVRLIDACTDIHLWAQTCTYGLTNRFADEDAITARIAAAIESQVFAAEEKRQRQKPLEELNATDYVLKAIMLTKVRSQQNYASAQRFLSRAIELDPYCARAHAIAAYFFGLQVLWGWKPRQETIPLAVEAAHNAIVLDDHDPWAHFAFGWALTQNRSPEEAIEAYEKAIAINPYFRRRTRVWDWPLATLVRSTRR